VSKVEVLKLNPIPIAILAVVIVGILAAIVLVSAKKSAGAPDEDEEWPYYAKRVMSAPELDMFRRLQQVLPRHIVLSQVAISRILGVQKGHNFGEWFNRINRMSADFVVCAEDASIVAVIELDDSSHLREDRKSADAKKDKALSAAGIRVIRWAIKSLPSDAEIRATLAAVQ
jgi:hypothetical protein